MKTFREIETTTIVNEDMTTETKTRTTLHTIKTWDELEREQQEEEIQKRQEDIYMLYQDYLYENFKCDLEYLKETFKNIDFDTIYIDSNSQGWWVDKIEDFRYYNNGIDIYGEHLEIEDIDFHIRKYIEDFEINIYDYYIDADKLKKLKTQKNIKIG